MNIVLNIDKSILKEIEITYGDNLYHTVETVAMDIIERYLNIEYFDPKLIIEDDKDEKDSLETYLLNEIKETIQEIFANNEYDNSLFDAKLLQKELFKDSFIITEYEICRINTLAEVYFKLTNNTSRYCELIELFASYDIIKFK